MAMKNLYCIKRFNSVNSTLVDLVKLKNWIDKTNIDLVLSSSCINSVNTSKIIFSNTNKFVVSDNFGFMLNKTVHYENFKNDFYKYIRQQDAINIALISDEKFIKLISYGNIHSKFKLSCTDPLLIELSYMEKNYCDN